MARESFNPHHVEDSHQASVYVSGSQIVGDFDYHVGGAFRYDGLEFDREGDLALGFNNSALLGNGDEVLGSGDASFGLDLGDAGRLRLTGTYGYVDFLETFALNPGVQGETFGFLTEEPRGGKSFRESYTVNLTYENDDVFGSAVKLEAFTSDVETETFSTFEGTNFRDEQSNAYIGIRSAITTPLDFVIDGATATYGLDVTRNNYFRPFFIDDTNEIDTSFPRT